MPTLVALDALAVQEFVFASNRFRDVVLRPHAWSISQVIHSWLDYQVLPTVSKPLAAM